MVIYSIHNNPTAMISLLIQCLIGYLFIDKIPQWLQLDGLIALITRIIGIAIIVRALIYFII